MDEYQPQFTNMRQMFTNLGVDEGHDTTLTDDNMTKKFVQPDKRMSRGEK